jgi:hypothetical protein
MMLGDLGFALKLPSEVTRTGNCTGPKNIKEHQRTSKNIKEHRGPT